MKFDITRLDMSFEFRMLMRYSIPSLFVCTHQVACSYDRPCQYCVSSSLRLFLPFFLVLLPFLFYERCRGDFCSHGYLAVLLLLGDGLFWSTKKKKMQRKVRSEICAVDFFLNLRIEKELLLSASGGGFRCLARSRV